MVNRRVEAFFQQIKNPLAVRETSPFKIEVFKDWSEGTGLTKKIIETKVSTIAARLFKVGQIEQVKLTATNTLVQENSEHTLVFTSSNEVPGTAGEGAYAGISPAIHVKYPPTFSLSALDPEAPVKLSGEVLSLVGSPTYTLDRSIIYNENCVL